MTFTYGPNPTEPKDHIRFFLGETTAPSDVMDEEIMMIATQVGAVLSPSGAFPPIGTIYRACWLLATSLAARFTNAVNWSAGTRGSLSFQNATKYQHWTDLAARMQALLMTAPLKPLAGGITISGKEVQEQQTDRVPPFFTREMETEPGTDRTGETDPYGPNDVTYPI